MVVVNPVKKPVAYQSVSSSVFPSQPSVRPVSHIMFKSPGKIVAEFVIGFFCMWAVLWFHAWFTRSQFGGLIFDTRVALTYSLVLSVVILVVYVILVVLLSTRWKMLSAVIGSVLGALTIFLLSEGVREGFAIFFAFI